MWWLPRRKGFDVRTWRAPCHCKHGHDSHDPCTRSCRLCACGLFRSNYACLGCDGPQEQHETCFELAVEREAKGRPVGRAFAPLAGCSVELQHATLGACNGGGRRLIPDAAGGVTDRRESCLESSAHTQSLEQMFEDGLVSATEYHRLIAAQDPSLFADCPSCTSFGSFASRAAAPEPSMHSSNVAPTCERRLSQFPTVRQARVRCSDGSEALVMTNIGAPLPVPGKDWSRPWEAAGR